MIYVGIDAAKISLIALSQTGIAMYCINPLPSLTTRKGLMTFIERLNLYQMI